MDFTYERIKTQLGVKLEIVSGEPHYKGKVWLEIARQIYCENGKDDYREIGHFPSGAPFLYNEDVRISISHTEGCLAVATVPASPDSNLSEFTPSTALGVDVERADREKVTGLRARFLSESELDIVPAESMEANVIAWTCKEAMLKAGLDPRIDWHHDIIITSLPTFEKEGSGFIRLNGEKFEFRLFTLKYEDFIITIAR